jgi:hypothetical protein
MLIPAVVQSQQSPVWTIDPAKMIIPQKPVAGMIHGLSFAMEEAGASNIDSFPVLTIRRGEDYLPDLAAKVEYFIKPGEKLDNKILRITPASESSLTRVYLEWKDQKGQWHSERFEKDYAMILEFGKTVGGITPGKIYLCLPDEAKSVVAGTFSVEVFDPEHPLGNAAGISGKVLIKNDPHEIEFDVGCLGMNRKGQLENPSTIFKIDGSWHWANLYTGRSKITSVVFDKKTGAVTHWHNHRAPGWYLVFLEGHKREDQTAEKNKRFWFEGYYDWKWVELKDETSQVTVDLSVDPANLGAVEVAVTGAPANAIVTCLPLRPDGTSPWPAAYSTRGGTIGVKVAGNKAVIHWLREGRYQLGLVIDRVTTPKPLATVNVEVKRGVTAKAKMTAAYSAAGSTAATALRRNRCRTSTTTPVTANNPINISSTGM